jgi:sirohydrochlorin cobaltochelatase
MEYAYDKAIFNEYKNQFKKMTLGTSLIYWQGQEKQTDEVSEALKAMSTQFPKLGKHDALLIMDHGTPHPSNAYYSVMQARLHEMGMNNVYIYTVEELAAAGDRYPAAEGQWHQERYIDADDDGGGRSCQQ